MHFRTISAAIVAASLSSIADARITIDDIATSSGRSSCAPRDRTCSPVCAVFVDEPQLGCRHRAEFMGTCDSQSGSLSRPVCGGRLLLSWDTDAGTIGVSRDDAVISYPVSTAKASRRKKTGSRIQGGGEGGDGTANELR